MTQIFTGEGLGLQNSSLGLGSYGPKGAAALGQGGESVYVNAANGNLVLRQSDGFLADIGFGLDLFQTYNSRGEGSSAWCFNLQSRLEFDGKVNTTRSSVTRVAEDGHYSRFLFDAKKQAYIPEEGGTAILTYSQNGWIYHEGNQKTSSYYSKEGQLTEIRDKDAHSVYFKYDKAQLISIVDTSGKQKITWSFQNGLLSDVTTTSDGVITHHLHYEYDDHQRLHKVSRDLGQGKTFWITYDYAGDSNRISDIKQSDGTSLHIQYDAQGRVKKLIDGEGRITNYEYQSGKTTVTNGLGESWTYYYDEKSRLTGVDGPEHYRIRYQYEGALLSSIIQGKDIWKFTYNDQGDCIRIEEPSGQITKRIYDSAHQVISETKYQRFDGEHHPVKPQTTRYIYDERGHLLFTIAADGTVTERRYDEQGQLISSRCYLLTGYDVSAVSEEGLITKEALQAWISQQNPQKISLIDYCYDWRGQLIEERHYSQVDAFGNGLPAGALINRSRYDASGRLVEKSIPLDGGWSITQYFYDDLGRLIKTIDNQNHNQTFEYDDAHKRIIQTDANGLQTIRIYDHSGLLLSVMRLDNKQNYGTTTYKYDTAGRLIAQIGVDGQTIYTFYDQQGRVQAQVNASGQLTETLYDDEGYVLKTYQYEQHLSTKDWLTEFPSFASIKPQTSLDDRITQIVYNQYHQVAYRIDAQGAVIGYEYDAQGQLIAKTAYANRLSEFNPQQGLNLETIKLVPDSKDRRIRYYYDLQGRLEAQIDGEGYATEYHYDRLGHLLETCKYDNPVSSRVSGDWSKDKPTANVLKDIHTYHLYDASGLKIADIDGEGYLIEYRYDTRGFLLEKVSYEKAITKDISINETTLLAEIRPLEHDNDHHSTYQYNDLGLLIQERNHTGLITTYTYDEMNQLVTKTLIDEQTHTVRQQRHRYDILGRVIQSLDELGSDLLKEADLSQEQIEIIWQKHSIRYEYNNAGLLLTKINALNQSTHYFYDEANDLRYTVNADGAVLETGFNHFGQVAFTRSFSAYLKSNVKDLSTEELTKRLNSLQDDRFDEYTRYEYNTIGQVIAKHTGTQGLITTSYNVFGELELSSQKINANKQTITSFEYDKRGLLTKRIDDIEGLTKNAAFKYDAFGETIQITDGRSNAINYVLNKRGEQIRIINASGQFKCMTYDAHGRVLRETNYGASGGKLFSYDDKNNSFTVENVTDQSKVVTQFNAFGDKIAIKDANGFTTEFHFDVQGQLIRTDGPEQTFKEYRYDEAGHLIWQQNAEGQIIEYSYDVAGHMLTKAIDPEHLNLITSYQFDAIGRQLKITDANGGVKQFVYDNQGHLIQSCIDPDGLHLVTEFSYDDRGLLIRQTEINSNGTNKTTAYEWDNLGRRTATIIDPNGLKITTTYQYDANDNLVCQIDANQHSTHYIYDATNRCRYQINARGVVTEHLYDVNGNEKQTVTYAIPISVLALYDEATLKSVLKEDPLHDQYQFRLFNSQGQITISYDALGYATTYGYDKNGNMIYSCNYAKAVSIDRLKNGEPVLPSKDDMREQYYIYDGLNQLRFKCNSRGYITESQYDKSGQLTGSIQYAEFIRFTTEDTHTLDYILENLNHNTKQDQNIHYAYDKAGRLLLELSAEGIAKSYQYDNLGKVIASTQYATRVSNKDLTQLDSLIKSANDRTTHFVYDTAGRELYRISGEGKVLERRYDAVGNILSELTHSIPLHLSFYNEESIKNALQTDKEAKVTQYEYDSAGRLLTQINAQQRKTQYTYDAQGNVLSKTEANTALWTYQYDEANQLIETRSPITEITSGKGKEKRSVITQNSYDSFGNLIAVIRDTEGLKQKVCYEFDNKNQKIKTLYPDAKVNNATANSSNQRQEFSQTLTEEIQYNAFGEVIASSDKAGHWKHYAYNNLGLLLFSVDNQNGLTQYQYDAFGRSICKTRFAVPLTLNENTDYTWQNINAALPTSTYDRHESYIYNLDNQVIEVIRDPVRMYNSKTAHYDLAINPSTQYIYNAFGDVIKTSVKINESEWADTYNYYDKEGHKTAVIDAEGYLTTYQNNIFGEVESMTEFALAAQEWDLSSYKSNQSSDKDRTVTYTYDILGQLTCKTLKQVRFDRLKAGTNQYESQIKDLTTTYTYDALGHLTTTTDPMGNTVYCYYDELGQLTAKIGPKTQEGRSATTYSYDALGNLVETKRWAQGTLTADANHFVLKGASSQDIVTSREYDTQGLLIAETDGLKHQVYYSYDANGNLARSWSTLRQIDNSTLTQDKRYTYDKENHLLQTATFKNSGALHTEDAQYNAFGELIAKGTNGNYNTHVEYDQLGRVWRSNTQGYYQIFVYDLMDHVTQIVTSTNGVTDDYHHNGLDLSTKEFEAKLYYDQGSWSKDLQRQNNTYDALGHLLKQTKEYSVYCTKKGDGAQLETATQSQTVDRWGNMLSFTNALGLQTNYEYNAFNQLIKQELPEVRVVDEHGIAHQLKPINYYAYDELGNAIAMVDANGHAVSKEYDALGRVILERDAKGNTRRKHYNLLDQLTQATNELGGVTTYTYDAANRLTSVNTPKTHQEYQYDEAGQLIQQKNGNEATSFWYDSVGNQIKRRSASGYDTHYEYNDAGHKTKERDANGNSQSWIYNDQGKVVQHTDLGGQVTSYEYNTNGLVIDEKSSKGKHIKYDYEGDGALYQYHDEGLEEVVTYGYDVEGQLTSKVSSRNDTAKDSWLTEFDFYQYDALGRLVQVRRRNPDDIRHDAPDIDHSILSIDYDYDAVGNIRHTQVSANYTNYEKVQNEDYYLYDETNRMTVNKGQLVNGQIMMTSVQGSTTAYDAAGNIKTAAKYENGAIQNYQYTYNNDNQLDLIQKNDRYLQAKFYDSAGRVYQEDGFNERNQITQRNSMTYENGLLRVQKIKNYLDQDISKSLYSYDSADNLIDLSIETKAQPHSSGSTLYHHYTYELWDNYQQSVDEATQIIYSGGTTKGKSTRIYNINGQLQESKDEQGTNSTYYKNSSVEGIKGRQDKDGQTNYLNVTGKTIGDLHLSKFGKQSLTVYGGFTPSGSQQKMDLSPFFGQGKKINQTINSFLNRSEGDKADGTAPEAPQDNLGTYTLQAGDTLEHIALQVYGDSSLWYLIADANGLSDKNASAGNSSQLHIGQRINIPPVATGQHHTSGTHKVLNANQMIGNTSATTPLPPTPPPLPKKSNNIFSTIVVGIIAIAATVLTAGIAGALAGVAEAGAGIWATGMAVLGGGLMASTAGSMAAGFTAGFVGSIISQGAASALNLQDGINFKGALINGLATAATAGVLRNLNGIESVQNITKTLDEHSLSKTFSITSAAKMMEQNTINQSINLALTKHQHFDWTQLAAAGATAGLMGSSIGKGIDKTLSKIDHLGLLSSELNSLTHAALQATTGIHFDAIQVLKENLGNSIASAVTDKIGAPEIEEENIPKGDDLYLTDTVLDMIHPERSSEELYRRYEAQKICGSNGYESLKWHAEKDEPETFENNTYWGMKEHGVREFVNNVNTSVDAMGLSLNSTNSNIIFQDSKYSFEEAVDKQMHIKGKDGPKYWVGSSNLTWGNASREQVIKAMDVDALFSDPVKKMQFLDLHYQEGFNAKDLDALLDGKGRLSGKGAVFLKASKDNNINPIYLVSHALLESKGGESALAKQNNFFGFGAVDGNALAAGTKFAKQHGWTTPELGIMGAAKIISERWVNHSSGTQNTLYAMRWNPNSPGNYQYATDIGWASNQTDKIYNQVNKMQQINHSYQPLFVIPQYRY